MSLAELFYLKHPRRPASARPSRWRRSRPARRPIMETLEPRILLSADPVNAILDTHGTLTLTLDAHVPVVITHLAESLDGGEQVQIQAGTETRVFGDASSGAKRVTIDTGA